MNRVVVGGAYVKTICHANSWIVDSTPPSAVILGGTLDDSSAALTFRLSYNATDSLSFIQAIRVGLGASRYDSAVKPWETRCRRAKEDGTCADTDEKTATLVAATDIVIPTTAPGDQPMFIRLAAINNVKLLSLLADSLRLVYDQSAPIAGDVFNSDHTHHNRKWMAGTKVDISWAGFEDPESSITRYEVCLGTAPQACDAVDAVDVVANKHTVEMSVDASYHNTELFATVTAFNGGFKTLSVNASGAAFRVDLTPPLPGTVAVVNAMNLPTQFVGDDHFARATWQGFSDPESLVVNYEFAVGTAAEPEEFLRFHAVGCDLNDDLCLINVSETHALLLAHKAAAIVSIRATNGAGATVASQSAPFTG
jgi:hypothetical protein